MASYDDWVYDRGLEDEDWVHDRWGDDDDDDYDDWDDFENDNKEGENEDMDALENRISFVRDYTEAEMLAIDTKINRILKELKDLEVGPCAFKLNSEITAVYYLDTFNHSFLDKSMKLTFLYKNYSLGDSQCWDTYSAKSLFIFRYENGVKQELIKLKNNFLEEEKQALEITYTREDGIDTICKAHELGKDVNIIKYLELPDLTEEEIYTFVSHGFGYNLFLEENTPYRVKDKIRHMLNYGKREEIEDCIRVWIRNNKNKCINPNSVK